jgi:hypothetical protein
MPEAWPEAEARGPARGSMPEAIVVAADVPRQWWSGAEH